eukprot:8455090-Heterocapsa_arctica.AAC.1
MGTTRGSEPQVPDPQRQQEAAAEPVWHWGQQPVQEAEADQRPLPVAEAWDVYSEGQQDDKQNGQEAPERRKDPMAHQPKRGGDMPPEGQQRAME